LISAISLGGWRPGPALLGKSEFTRLVTGTYIRKCPELTQLTGPRPARAAAWPLVGPLCGRPIRKPCPWLCEPHGGRLNADTFSAQHGDRRGVSQPRNIANPRPAGKAQDRARAKAKSNQPLRRSKQFLALPARA
jgi:hypothetical protein